MMIYELVQTIRRYINKPIKQHQLLKNNALWNQLCSSMDVIEDTDLAIESYVNREFEEKTGTLYLAVYGLLQALFIQQNAVIHLIQSLNLGGIDLSSFPKLKTVRNIRNDAIGHPTKREHKKPISYHYLSRATLNYEGFQLLSFYSNGSHKFKDINITKCIADQNVDIRSILSKIIDSLREEEIAHKEKFKNEKLQEVFPQTTHYYFEKIYESISNPEKYPADFGLSHVNLVRDAIKNFQKELAKRGIRWETYAGIKDTCEQVEYSLSKVEGFLESLKDGKSPSINEKDAHIFWENSRQHFDELVQIAREIDEEYSQLP